MELVNHIAEEYAQQYSAPLDVVLQQVEADTIQQHHPAHAR